ncbi:A2478-like protein, partial [Mya arenaria]
MPSQMVVFSMLVAIEMNVLGLNFFEEVLEVVEQLLEKIPPTWGGYWLLNNFPGSFEDPGSKTMINYKGSLTFFFNKQVPFTFTKKTDFWDYEKDGNDPPIVRTYLAGTLLQPGRVGKEFRAFMREQLFVGVARDLWIGCTGILLGGKTTEGSLESTPLHPGYRSTVTSLSCGIALADAESGAPLLNQTTGNNELIEYFQTFGSGMYLNEPWKDNPYWKEDFWGTENYERLLLIKRRYDQDNLFTCHHCVGSDVMDKTNPGPAPPVGHAFTCLASWSLVIVTYL